MPSNVMWNETYIISELPSEAETEDEIEFIWDLLELEPGMIILDLCCGQGRHARRFSDLGCQVVGLDSSRYLLDEAKKSIDDKNVGLIEGDMRQIPLKNVADAVVSLFTSFGFFDELGNRQVVSEIARVLKPGGKLLIDYWNPHTVAQLDGMRNWWWIDDETLILLEASYHAGLCIIDDHRVTVDLKTGEIEQSVNHVRFYFPTELEKMLNEVGLEVVEMYGDFDGELFDLYSRRFITVAKRVNEL